MIFYDEQLDRLQDRLMRTEEDEAQDEPWAPNAPHTVAAMPQSTRSISSSARAVLEWSDRRILPWPITYCRDVRRLYCVV
jgi:hypothetical protein